LFDLFTQGVCLTHQNLVTNLLQCDEVEGMAFPLNHKLISPLPFFHIYAFTVSMMYPAWKGNTVITNSGRFDLEQFCQLVEEHKPERAHLVPPILHGLAKHPIVEKYDMSSLRMIVSAAAPLGKEMDADVSARLGCNVKQAWGMSELSPIGTINSDFNAKMGSVGPLVSSTFAKIVDAKGNSLGPEEDGELLIKGPQVMLGYLVCRQTLLCVCVVSCRYHNTFLHVLYALSRDVVSVLGL
jgi:4-coumarate--CoA ligase